MGEQVGKQGAKQPDYDVLIVGGGLVGATLACALADSPLKLGLIEAHEPPVLSNFDPDSDFEPRVSALTLASRNILQNLGVWQHLHDHRHSPFRAMRVWDAEGTGSIEFNAEDLGQAEMGYILENSLVVAALYEQIRKYPNVELICPAKLADIARAGTQGRSLTLKDGSELGARLIVGADGAQSRVREKAGMDTREWDYRQQAIVCTVKTQHSHRATAWQSFLSSGPLAFLPLRSAAGDDHHCSIVWSADTARAEQLMALDDQAFAEALERGLESRLGKIEFVDKRHAFPLRQRHARDYTQPGLALVGDAAHSIHPLAGQGVNLGLLDAAVLAEEILRAGERQVDLYDPSLLQRYQRRRAANNLGMMALMEGFKRLFGETALPVRWLRNVGMSMVDSAGPAKNLIAEQAMGLSGDLPKLARF